MEKIKEKKYNGYNIEDHNYVSIEWRYGHKVMLNVMQMALVIWNTISTASDLN